MAEDSGKVTVAKLEIDAEQLKTVPPLAAGVGAATEKALAGIDASVKMTASQFNFLSTVIRKEAAAVKSVQAKATADVEAELQKKIQLERVAANETIDLNRAALAELLQIQRTADAKELADLKAQLAKLQATRDAAAKTRGRKQKAQLDADLQAQKAASDLVAQTSKQDHQKAQQDTLLLANSSITGYKVQSAALLQNQRLIANSAVAQAYIVNKAQIAASTNATRVTIANSTNAAKVQIAQIWQVTAQQQAAAKAQLSAQNFQQRRQLQRQAPAAGVAGRLTALGSAIYTIRTVVQGAQQVMTMAANMERTAVAYDRQLIASKNLAGGITNLNKLMEAYTKATGGAVDRVTSLQDVTRLQAIGFADNAEEIERFVRVSRGISLAVGKDMADITQEVALTIANQSTRRLDQIGLGVTEVRDRIAELREENKTWTREMAFQEAVLQIAGEKYGGLTDSLEAQATGVEKLTASWKDYMLVLAEAAKGPIQEIAETIAKELDESAKIIEQRTREGIRTSAHDIPGGFGNITLDTARQRQASLIQMREEQRANPNKLPTEALASVLQKLTDDIRKTSITIAGIQAKMAMGSDWVPPSGAEDYENVPKKADYTGDQWMVLMEAEQDRNAMEEGFAKQRSEISEEYNEQRADVIADYEKQIARDAEDFARQRADDQREHQEAMADVIREGLERQAEMAEDLADRIAKANRDSADRIAEIEEDYGRKVADMREDSADQIKELDENLAEEQTELKEESSEKLLDMEEEYQEDRKKNMRQYEDDITSAAANLDARAVWEAQRRFAREEEEAEKSHNKKVAEEKEALQKSLDEAQEKHDEGVEEEKKSLQKQIDQATEMRDEQIEDEGEALKKRNEDARTAHQEQLDDAIKKDDQRLRDMQTDFDKRIEKEDADRLIRMGRLQQDHLDQLEEMGIQQGKRLAQIGEQEREAREAFDKAYTQRLADAGIYNTAWMLAQAAAEDESLDLFIKLFQGINSLLGETLIKIPNATTPLVDAYLEDLYDLQRKASDALDRAQTPQERADAQAQLNWINELIATYGPLAGTSGIGGEGQLVTKSGTDTTVVRSGAVGGEGGMAITVEAGAIVINAAAGQSMASVGEEFGEATVVDAQESGSCLMSDYRVGVGTNIALASLAVMNPQPTSPGLQYTRQVHLGNGHVINQGAYVEWIYNVVEDAAQYIAILTPFGLNVAGVQSQAVTIYTRDELYSYRRYNGVAHRPPASWDNYFIREVSILIRDLVQLA